MLLREIVLIATCDLIGVVSFGLVEEGSIFVWVFGAPEFNDTPISKFNATGYGSQYLICNMGTMFFALLTILIMTFFTIVCKPFEQKSKRIKTKMDKWRKGIYWNSYLRFMIEGCLEIFIGIFLNWLSKNELNEGFLTKWDDRF